MGVKGEAGSLLDSGAAVACWESEVEVKNRGQDEEGGSCRQVEGAMPGSAAPHRGEEEEGRTEGRSPLDSGREVCKRTPLNWTEAVVDDKRGMAGLVSRSVASSLEVEALGVELLKWTSGRRPCLPDTPPSVVVPSITGLLLRDRDAAVVLLNEEPLVNMGVVGLTPPAGLSKDSPGLTAPRTPCVSVLEFESVVAVETKDSVVVVKENKELPLKSVPPLLTSGGRVEVLPSVVSSERLRTCPR